MWEGHVYQDPPESHISHSDSLELPCNQQKRPPRIPSFGERISQRMWSQTWFPLKTPGDLLQTTILSWREASSTTSVTPSASTCGNAISLPTLTTYPNYGCSKRASSFPPPPLPIYSAPRPSANDSIAISLPSISLLEWKT